MKEFGFSPTAQKRLINLSENSTYLIDDPDDGRERILRVHRQDYHAKESIESELMWLDAVRTDTSIRVPTLIPADDGRRVVSVWHEGHIRHTVLFDKIGGVEPAEELIGKTDFHTLGGLTAILHRHALEWQLPSGFHRFSWDWEHTLGNRPRWGRWEDGIGIGSSEVAHLSSVCELIRTKLDSYGTGADRFGLVHADLRLANLLV